MTSPTLNCTLPELGRLVCLKNTAAHSDQHTLQSADLSICRPASVRSLQYRQSDQHWRHMQTSSSQGLLQSAVTPTMAAYAGPQLPWSTAISCQTSQVCTVKSAFTIPSGKPARADPISRPGQTAPKLHASSRQTVDNTHSTCNTVMSPVG